MHRFCKALSTLILTGVLFSAHGQITTTYFYHSISANWAGTGTSSAFRDLGTDSRKFTLLANFTGNNFYKVNNQPNNSDNDFNAPSGSKVWSGGLSIGSFGTASAYGDGNGGASSFPVTNGKYYTYIWQDVNTSSNASALVMETTNAPVDISTVSASPSTPTPSTPVTVTVNLSAAPSSEEKVYVRYSTNNFASYGTLLSSASGSGTATQTFTIPAQPAATVVKYYAFTSTLASGSLSGNAFNTDMAVIDFSNNGGVNFAYTVLPIELVSFKVEKSGEANNLHWQTATETNNRAFQIERSPDAQNWETLDQITGAGNSYETKNYSWADRQPLDGTSFYRLRQIDFDGQTNLSPVRKVERTGAAVFTVYPNPTVSSTTIKTTSSTEGEALVDLVDATGRYVGTVHFGLQKGENLLVMPLDGMPGGWYTLVYSAANGHFSQRILIKSE